MQQLMRLKAIEQRALAQLDGRMNFQCDDSRQARDEFRATTLTKAHRMISSAAHDLRSPLATVRGYCDLLEEDLTENNIAAARESIRVMAAISERALELVNRMMNVEQFKTAPSEFSRVSLNEVLREAIMDLGQAVRESDAEINYEELPEIEGDHVQLRSLFQNLMGNSIKYRRKGVRPVIRVSCRKREGALGSWYEIEVADNGCGFDAEAADKIFQPFVRLEATKQVEGFGVGLSNCESIVRRHQGEIRAVGKLGVGAQFKIWFPVKVDL